MAKQSQKTDTAPQTEEKGSTFAQILYDWLSTLFLAVVVIRLVMTFFVRQVTVKGSSMNDTLQTQDRLLVSSFLYHPQNGDIVIVTHGDVYDDAIIKRVIAVEGQHLEINYETSEIYVDGKLVEEPYAKGRTIPLSNPTPIPEVIPKGYVFVMGDNREDSLDSRSARIGLIPVENIIGKAFWRIQPFSTFGGVS